MEAPRSTIPPQVIACIREGRAPLADELALVADRIWRDVQGTRSAFAWGDLSEDNAERILVTQVARAALAGRP